MKIRALKVAGGYEITPQQWPDERGVFLESFRSDLLRDVIGHTFKVAQTNVSVSAKGVVRGIHYADVPPSQAKYITALSGTTLDFVVDIRVGSPTFGQWDSVLLDPRDRRSVYVAEGLGHAMVALEEGASVMYLCSTPYAPAREHTVNALDPEIGLPIPPDALTLSPRDAEAPSLAEGSSGGILPNWEDCCTYYDQLSRESL